MFVGSSRSGVRWSCKVVGIWSIARIVRGGVSCGQLCPAGIISCFLHWVIEDFVRSLDGLELGHDLDLMTRVAVGVILLCYAL